jgi:hypothetical protein
MNGTIVNCIVLEDEGQYLQDIYPDDTHPRTHSMDSTRARTLQRLGAVDLGEYCQPKSKLVCELGSRQNHLP